MIGIPVEVPGTMKRTNPRLRFCVILLAMNLLFIWGNSLLPGELSGAVSLWLKKLLHFGGEDSQAGHGLLRKLAHFTEFASLGLLWAWLWGMLGKKPGVSLLSGFLVACVDETIQIFVPDRGPGVKDVLIDTCGVCLGVAALHLICSLKKRKQSLFLEDT